MYCYEDNRLLKLFCDIVRLLYDAEILGEDTVRHWCVGRTPTAACLATCSPLKTTPQPVWQLTQLCEWVHHVDSLVAPSSPARCWADSSTSSSCLP